jgi:DNA-binding response OmpR family regulator
MAEPVKVLLISNENRADMHWQLALREAGLNAELTAAASGYDGISAIEEDPPHALAIVHGLPAIEAVDIARHVRKIRAHLPILVFASDSQVVAQALTIEGVVALHVEDAEACRTAGARILSGLLTSSSQTQAPRSVLTAGASAPGLAIALEVAGNAAQSLNAALQTAQEQSASLRNKLKDDSPERPSVVSIETSLRQASSMNERILHCAKASEGVRLVVGLHDLLQSIFQVLRAQAGARFRPEINLTATRTEFHTNIFSFSQSVVHFLQSWIEIYGGAGPQMTIITENLRPEGSTATGGEAFMLKAEEARLRIMGRGLRASGPEFDPGADPAKVQGVLPVGLLVEAARVSRGRVALSASPEGEPIADLILPLAERLQRDLTTGVTMELRGSGHILLVDDELVVRAMAQKMLRSLGYKVETASDGPEAVKIFEADPAKYDLVLADMTMPAMDGEQLFHVLKAIRDDVRFVLASDVPEVIAENRLVRGQHAGFIQKPYRVRELGLHLKRILRRS